MANRQMYNLKIYIFFLFYLALGNLALAQELHDLNVLDVSGVVRATAKLENSGHILFLLNDEQGLPAEKVKVTITNTADSHQEKTFSKNGKAVFCDLPVGTWQVTSDVPWAVFTDIQIEPSDTLLDQCDSAMGGLLWPSSSSSNASNSRALGGYSKTAFLGRNSIPLIGGATLATVAVVSIVHHQNNSNDQVSTRPPLSPSR